MVTLCFSYRPALPRRAKSNNAATIKTSNDLPAITLPLSRALFSPSESSSFPHRLISTCRHHANDGASRRLFCNVNAGYPPSIFHLARNRRDSDDPSRNRKETRPPESQYQHRWKYNYASASTCSDATSDQHPLLRAFSPRPAFTNLTRFNCSPSRAFDVTLSLQW